MVQNRIQNRAGILERATTAARKTALFSVSFVALLSSVHAQDALRAVSPEVTIAHLDEVRWQIDGASVDLTLRVRNPKAVNLPLQALHFRCFFQNTAVAAGDSLTPVTIPANGGVLVPVRVNVDNVTLEVVSEAIANGQPLAYRIDGTAEIGLTGLSVPFTYSGAVALGASAGNSRH